VSVSSGLATPIGNTLLAVPPLTSEDLFSRPDNPGPGLATASDGHVWSNDLNVYPNGMATIVSRQAFIQTASAWTDHDTWMGDSYSDAEITVDLDMTNVAVDPNYQHGARILARVQGNDKWIVVTINPTSQTLTLWTDNSGNWTQFAAASASLSQGAWYHAKVDVVGTSVNAKVWPVGTPEPSWQIQGNQTVINGPGKAGLRTTVADTYYQNFQATSF